ncbi:MAG: J domain-containing protein [Actinobacteria bacterium]|nr:MAG: J domain-containing protein [Actinomycetota bacterium]
MKDHYKALEVHPHASPEVIDKAYRILSLKHHPDRQPAVSRKAATEKMQRLNEAYAVLSDPQRRRCYDRERAMGQAARENEHRMVRVFLDDGLVGLFKLWVRDGIRE